MLWAGSLLGCGVMEPAPSLALERGESFPQHREGINGLSTNGLSTNGLSTNGLSTHGLSDSGLSSSQFTTWFNQNPSLHDIVMRYVFLCAVPVGQERTWTNPVTGDEHTWEGKLGLAPDWTHGSPATELEQQVVSACLAAHTNKFELSVPISVLGRTARGLPIPFTPEELEQYSHKEACFFGNLFNGEGIFAANNREALDSRESTARACGLSSEATSYPCPPIVHVGSCEDFCTLDITWTYYTQCTYNGVTYQPITTRMRPDDIYRCGDGTCQETERCGTGTTYNNCMADCGLCP